MSTDFTTTPLDPAAVERLAGDGLRFALVDTSDVAAFDTWLEADMRGFHGERLSTARRAEMREAFGYRRTTGVWDASSADPGSPVATVNSWPVALTVPGGRDVQSWAISSVTVAPTHRRRGIARTLLETELHTAAALDVPLAILTVSESTIYGRFGFAPATFGSTLKVDTTRAHWAGPAVDGRVHFVPLEALAEWAPSFFERVRLDSPGAIEPWETMWNRIIPTTGETAEKAKGLRGVRYDDANGEPQGFAVYTVKENDRFSHHELDLAYLLTATDDAYAGLWRFLLEIDLVSSITAHLRPVGEPLPFMVSDYRAVQTTAVEDHLWVRILDVPRSLEARSYAAPGRFALQVTDSLGYAAGTFMLTVTGEGSATVAKTDEIPDDAAAAALGINELGALYLGGVSARTLTAAGRVTELTPGAADALDSTFRSPATAWQSFWF